MSVARNIYLGLLAKLPGGRFFLSRREADRVGSTWVERLKVRTTGNGMKVVELSGGNQQKVVIAKSLVQEPDLIIFDEPTRGVDVGAIVEIHELIQRLADEGKAVVVISSYLPEIMALSDRILVSRQGKVVEEFSAVRGDRREDHVRGGALSGPKTLTRRAGSACSGSIRRSVRLRFERAGDFLPDRPNRIAVAPCARTPRHCCRRAKANSLLALALPCAVVSGSSAEPPSARRNRRPINPYRW